MKQQFLLTAIAVLIISTSAMATTKKEAPKRQYWGYHRINDVSVYDIDNPLYGNVESITITRKKNGERMIDKIYKFNQKGDVVDYSTRQYDGKMHRYIYAYDSQGNNTAQLLFFDANDIFSGFPIVNFYKYTSQERVIEETRYDELSWEEKQKIDNGECSGSWLNYSRIEKIRSGNRSVHYWKYDYDSYGNMIAKTWCDGEGPTKEKYIYKYDSQGNEIERASYDSDGSLRERYLYKYDSQGNMIEQILGSSVHSDGPSKRTWKYDSQGNMIESATYGLTGSLNSKSTYSYEYDSQGNWIKKVIVYYPAVWDGRYEYIYEEREIVYRK